uniref:Matrix-remodeling-associated protein 7 helical domain-containing protein n=1 Tax=Bursaphelenchus xylophilus TaxID=6326 RepID=A0A1I7RV11_BURXY
MAFDELIEEMGGAFAQPPAGQEMESEEEAESVVLEPWWLIARRYGLNTYHPNWQDLLNDPTVRTALALVVLTAISLPLFSMFAYRFWRRKQNEKAGYKGHQQIPSDEADCVDSDEDSSPSSTCVSSPEIAPKLTKSEEKYAMKGKFVDFIDGKEIKFEEKEEKITFDGTRINNQLDFGDLKEEDVKKLVDMQWHGKLATAKLRAKANKLEETMSEEERKNEQRLKNEQLEKIFALMQQDKEKFGVNDKTEIMEQMKMYSL